MKKAIVLLAAAVVLMACARDRERTGSTTTTGAGTSTTAGTSVTGTTAAPTGEPIPQGALMKTKNTDAVRARMNQDRPQAAAVINELMITDDGTTIMISGIVPDEQTHQALVTAARSTPGVRDVKDNVRVSASR